LARAQAAIQPQVPQRPQIGKGRLVRDNVDDASHRQQPPRREEGALKRVLMNELYRLARPQQVHFGMPLAAEQALDAAPKLIEPVLFAAVVAVAAAADDDGRSQDQEWHA